MSMHQNGLTKTPRPQAPGFSLGVKGGVLVIGRATLADEDGRIEDGPHVAKGSPRLAGRCSRSASSP